MSGKILLILDFRSYIIEISVLGVQGVENKIRKGVKLFPYFMMLVVFAAALILPRYAAKWQAASLLENEISGAERTSEKMDETQNGQTIVIDPGHGGDDPGMISESGVSEKVLNLIYAKKLAVLLEAEGYEVVLTRSTEDGLYDADASNKKAQDMQRRVAIIEEADPILTVSIHQNSYPEDFSVKGPQVFYYEQSAEGEKLATAIQDSLNEELEIERPRVQKGNTTYYILKRSVSTTVIVECGFLTNPEEEELLQEEAYQARVAQAICDGILAYLLDKNEYN